MKKHISRGRTEETLKNLKDFLKKTQQKPKKLKQLCQKLNNPPTRVGLGCGNTSKKRPVYKHHWIVILFVPLAVSFSCRLLGNLYFLSGIILKDIECNVMQPTFNTSVLWHNSQRSSKLKIAFLMRMCYLHSGIYIDRTSNEYSWMVYVFK